MGIQISDNAQSYCYPDSRVTMARARRTKADAQETLAIGICILVIHQAGSNEMVESWPKLQGWTIKMPGAAKVCS
jgi:hypothetical protein